MVYAIITISRQNCFDFVEMGNDVIKREFQILNRLLDTK